MDNDDNIKEGEYPTIPAYRKRWHRGSLPGGCVNAAHPNLPDRLTVDSLNKERARLKRENKYKVSE